MSELDALLVNASDNTEGVFRLSPETQSVLFFALGLAQNLNNWRETRNEELSADTIDDIYEILDWANDELMREAVTMPVGAIMMWQETVPPANWLLCDGGAAFVAEWPELFDLWGYKYGGAGTQFGLPDYETLSPMGQGGTVGLDDTAGSLTHTLTLAQIPSHAHRIPKAHPTTASAINTSTPAARIDNVATPTMMTDGAGGGGSHPILHPVWGTNFIVFAGKQVL